MRNARQPGAENETSGHHDGLHAEHNPKIETVRKRPAPHCERLGLSIKWRCATGQGDPDSLSLSTLVAASLAPCLVPSVKSELFGSAHLTTITRCLSLTRPARGSGSTQRFC